jgi:uncharacterized protein (DUF1810 family)
MPFDLLRFVEIQENTYEQALAEVREGKKRNHWMAYIFPILRELDDSDESEIYGINSKAEAKAYINHPILGTRLREISRALFAFEGKTAVDIFGVSDAKKLISCMTLFAEVSEDKVIFIEVLRKYNEGEKDNRSLYLMQFL